MRKFISLSAGTFWFFLIYIIIEIINKYWWDRFESYVLGFVLAVLIYMFFDKKMEKL